MNERDMLEKIRREALARFEATDKDHTLDTDTAAWLLEVAQEIEAMQIEAQDADRARNGARGE